MGAYSYNTYKTTIERGDIIYVESVYQNEGSEQRAGRPAIIVSNNANNRSSTVVEVVYLTTQNKNELPTHVEIRSGKKPSTALCEQIDSVSKTRLGDYMATCTEAEMRSIDIALAISLGLNEMVKEVVIEKPVEVVVEKPVEVSTSAADNSDLVKAKAESEIYKQMYQDLLAKIMEK